MSDKRYQDVKENKMVPLTLLFAHSRNYREHPPSKLKNLWRRWNGTVRLGALSVRRILIVPIPS